MMQTIKWHEEANENFRKSLMRQQAEFNHISQRLQEMTEEYLFRCRQIEEAKKRKRAFFDAERFLKTREKPNKIKDLRELMGKVK